MSLASLIPEPHFSHLKFIFDKISATGNQCFLVGGSVRDLYMNQVPKEYDLTTSAHPETVKALFKTVIETGIKHGTVTVLLDKSPYEITTFRIDKDYVDGRHPTSVEFGTSLSEDLKRRDFTMNALALDFNSLEIIDEHEGKKDIDEKTIRTIGNPIDRFTEDGLRPIRALRFASVLGFKIESQTKLAIHKTKNITAKISVERLQDEITKSLKGKYPSIMLKLLVEEKILPLFLKDLIPIAEKNIENTNLKILDSLPKKNLGFLIGTWCHCLLPKAEPLLWERWLQGLKFSNTLVKDALFLLHIIQLSNQPDTVWDSYSLRRTILAPFKKHLQVRKMDTLSVWECFESFSWSWLEMGRELWLDEPALLLSDLKINGKDIESKFPKIPKSKYGELLALLLDEVHRVPENNEISFLYNQCASFSGNL